VGARVFIFKEILVVFLSATLLSQRSVIGCPRLKELLLSLRVDLFSSL
jgi:hypothetical protein